MTITIVDYGMGNTGSIRNMLHRIGADAETTSDPEVVARAERLILPGVGAFDNAMRRLAELDLVDALHRRVIDEGTPCLGVCLGMQLLTTGSDEGELPGLGWIEARTRRFDLASVSPPLPVPHMGWNTVSDRGRGTLFSTQPDGARFYFVHSYHVDCDDDGDVLGTTTYGIEFASAIARDNVVGVQFHPEKSHRFGMELLKAFAGP